MVKMIATLKRKPGMTRKEFSDYWRYHHAPLVQSVSEFTRYLRKYVRITWPATLDQPEPRPNSMA